MTAIAFPLLGLPKAKLLTDAVLGGETKPLDLELRVEFAERLLAGVASSPKSSPRHRLKMDAYSLRMALENPEQLDREESFAWSPRTSRRSLGLAAARRCIDRSARTPKEALRRVIAEHISRANNGQERTGSVGHWLASLPVGAKAVVEGEALTWASQFVGAFEWARLGDVAVGTADLWWDAPRPLQLGMKGRTDALAKSTGVGFTMLGGRPTSTSPAQLGLAPLVQLLSPRYAMTPHRVVGFWPQCGRTMILAVDRTLLEHTVDSVIKAIGANHTSRPLTLVAA